MKAYMKILLRVLLDIGLLVASYYLSVYGLHIYYKPVFGLHVFLSYVPFMVFIKFIFYISFAMYKNRVKVKSAYLILPVLISNIAAIGFLYYMKYSLTYYELFAAILILDYIFILLIRLIISSLTRDDYIYFESNEKKLESNNEIWDESQNSFLDQLAHDNSFYIDKETQLLDLDNKLKTKKLELEEKNDELLKIDEVVKDKKNQINNNTSENSYDDREELLQKIKTFERNEVILNNTIDKLENIVNLINEKINILEQREKTNKERNFQNSNNLEQFTNNENALSEDNLEPLNKSNKILIDESDLNQIRQFIEETAEIS